MLAIGSREENINIKVESVPKVRCKLFKLTFLSTYDIIQHFKKMNKLKILDKLRHKKVKEKKLLAMLSQEIQLLSFID